MCVSLELQNTEGRKKDPSRETCLEVLFDQLLYDLFDCLHPDLSYFDSPSRGGEIACLMMNNKYRCGYTIDHWWYDRFYEGS